MTASNANKKVKDIFVLLNKNENRNNFYRRLSKTGYEYVLIVMYLATNTTFFSNASYSQKVNDGCYPDTMWHGLPCLSVQNSLI